MENFIDVIRIVEKFSFCAAAGVFAYKAFLHVKKQKHYELCIIKLLKSMKNIIRPKSNISVRDLQVDYKIFWSENMECRKHIMSKLPCAKDFCSCYKLQYIKDFILSATESLDLCMYLLTSTDIANALIQVHKNGVKIRMIVEEEMSSSSESKVQLLIHAGISVKSKVLPTFMHHKFCLIDANNPNKHKLLTGSLNWTLQGIAGNWENIIIIHHKMATNAYFEEFNEIWDYFDMKPKTLLPVRSQVTRKF